MQHRWHPGQAGNPAGRKTNRQRAELQRAIRELFSPHCEEAKNTILHLMANSDDDKVRLRAAELVLDRVYGKPNQIVHLTSEEEAATMTDDELAVAARDILGRVGLIN